MKFTLERQTIRHILKSLAKDDKFIEAGFSFQISGKDDGEYIMKNGRASFVKNIHNDISVSYKGREHDLDWWLDCEDYDDCNLDSINITYIDFL